MTDSKPVRIVRILWIVLFLVFCLIPSLGMLFTGETKSSANEILSPKPTVMKRNGSFNIDVLKDTSDYFSDRFAFRKPLLTAWAQLNADLFHSSAEEQVVLGREGWLYFQPTMDDYMGRSMSEEDLDHAAAYLLSLQQEAESRGAVFLFTIAPNKNSLYPDYMPSYVPSGHTSSNAEKLKSYLVKYGVHYLDLFEIFSREDDTLYYRTDSHWTNRGAALAADSILAAMGETSSYYSGPFIPGDPHVGDLYEMLFPYGKETEESQQYSSGFSYTLSEDPGGGNAMKISSANENRDGTLLCWRDSFGISLYPFLADSFGNSLFLRSSNYDMNEIEKTGADFVLIELVERNLPQLATASK